jgi:hypothetical protein
VNAAFHILFAVLFALLAGGEAAGADAKDVEAERQLEALKSRISLIE